MINHWNFMCKTSSKKIWSNWMKKSAWCLAIWCSIFSTQLVMDTFILEYPLHRESVVDEIKQIPNVYIAVTILHVFWTFYHCYTALILSFDQPRIPKDLFHNGAVIYANEPQKQKSNLLCKWSQFQFCYLRIQLLIPVRHL